MERDADKAKHEPSIGSPVGDYIVRESIAAGGFGSVYRAEHRTNGTQGALKVLHSELAEMPDAVARFEREVDVVRRLIHPNIVEILDAGRLSDGRPYFVMELLIGVDLDTHMRAKRRLPPPDILSILEALCSALSLAHERGIIHRDLKASNVFLTAKDGKRRVVLLDFGVAKLVDEQGPGLTAMHHSVGTPFCMAPEQVMGQATDARTDVYALGALTYYMLTGELPFHDPVLQSLQYLILRMAPKKPSTVAPVGSAYDEVVLAALGKRATERPNSVNEFLARFRAVVEGAPIDTSEQYQRRMAAIYLQVRTTPDGQQAIEDGEEDICDDIEKSLPFARDFLKQKGYSPAGLLTGNSMLLVKELPGEPEREVMGRRDAVKTAIALEKHLETRPYYDDRVKIDICLHVGTVEIVGGKLSEGELLQTSNWVPRGEWSGVLGSESIFEGLGIKTDSASGVRGFSRVVEAA